MGVAQNDDMIEALDPIWALAERNMGGSPHSKNESRLTPTTFLRQQRSCASTAARPVQGQRADD
jgi:hypothetical protein